MTFISSNNFIFNMSLYFKIQRITSATGLQGDIAQCLKLSNFSSLHIFFCLESLCVVSYVVWQKLQKRRHPVMLVTFAHTSSRYFIFRFLPTSSILTYQSSLLLLIYNFTWFSKVRSDYSASKSKQYSRCPQKTPCKHGSTIAKLAWLEIFESQRPLTGEI